MTLPEISVIVPVYNSGKYLEKTVKSLVNQTYKNIEIILVDDGSVDESPAICDKLAEKHENVYVIHQTNSGVSVARNEGMKNARGQLIAFCDGDDIVEEDMYEFLYNQMIESNSDIAGCSCLVVTEDNSFNNKLTGEKKVWNDCDGYLRALFGWQLSMSVCNKLFKKEVIQNIQFPVGYKTNEDKFFCFLSALNSKTISFQDVGKYRYIRRKDSSSFTEFSDKYFDCIRLAEKMLEIIKDKKTHLTKEAQCNLLSTCLRIYKLIHTRNGLKNFSMEADKIYRYVKDFDIKLAKKYLSRNDYIRFMAAKSGKLPFRLFTKFVDKKAN